MSTVCGCCPPGDARLGDVITQHSSLPTPGTSPLPQGTIPPDLTDLEHLSTLRLASCNLSGTLPPELFLLRQLAVLDMSGNKGLAGSIPDTIGWVAAMRQAVQCMCSAACSAGAKGALAPCSTAFVDVSAAGGAFYLVPLISYCTIAEADRCQEYADVHCTTACGSQPVAPHQQWMLHCRRFALGLTEFNVAGTNISGAIPSTVQHLRFLTRFNIQGTRMSCCYTPAAGYSSAAASSSITGNCSSISDAACLPSFLEFDQSTAVPPPLDTSASAGAAGYYMK